MTVRRAFLWALFLPLALLGGCGGAENRPAVWSYISPAIVQPNCATASCHSRAVAVAGLDLSTIDDGHISLTALKIPRRSEVQPPMPRPLVAKFNPDQSRVLWMLRAQGADRMPPDRPLAEADIALIEQWILEGAMNN